MQMIIKRTVQTSKTARSLKQKHNINLRVKRSETEACWLKWNFEFASRGRVQVKFAHRLLHYHRPIFPRR